MIATTTNPNLSLLDQSSRTPYLRVKYVFPEPSLQSLLLWVNANERAFQYSKTETGEANYRHSRLVYQAPQPWRGYLESRIRQLLPHAFNWLEVAPVNPSTIECQLTAHHSGGYYRHHNDNGSPSTATRLLTYVFYFSHTPQAFTGGHLSLTGQGGTFHLPPERNTLVVFPSHLWHEVEPVYGATSWHEGRFTLNGWVRR